MADFHVIPSIDELRRRAAVRELEARFGPTATVDALRSAAARVRGAVARGEPVRDEQAAAHIEQTAAEWLDHVFGASLRRVINATGVVLHTNLGRAPLSPVAIERIAEIAGGYTSL